MGCEQPGSGALQGTLLRRPMAFRPRLATGLAFRFDAAARLWGGRVNRTVARKRRTVPVVWIFFGEGISRTVTGARRGLSPPFGRNPTQTAGINPAARLTAPPAGSPP